ncbi:MAG: hypothetical protein HY602_01480 [Parcubacteria group bacterium]|nr:hypothetical protein [Parcubacteria group bacterium]
MPKLLLTLLITVLLLPSFLFAAPDTPPDPKGVIPPQINVPIPFLPTEYKTEEKANWIAQYIEGWYNLGYALAGMLTLIMILIGGFLWASSMGNQQQIGKAKDIIQSAIIGLAIVLLSYTFLSFINPALVTLQPIIVKESVSKQNLEKFKNLLSSESRDLSDVYTILIKNQSNLNDTAYVSLFGIYNSLLNELKTIQNNAENISDQETFLNLDRQRLAWIEKLNQFKNDTNTALKSEKK